MLLTWCAYWVICLISYILVRENTTHLDKMVPSLNERKLRRIITHEASEVCFVLDLHVDSCCYWWKIVASSVYLIVLTDGCFPTCQGYIDEKNKSSTDSGHERFSKIHFSIHYL